MTNNWSISHPIGRVIAYVAPFVYLALTGLSMSEGGINIFGFVFYATITYFAVLQSLSVRDTREVSGGGYKTLYVFSCLAVFFFALCIILGVNAGILAIMFA